FAALWVRPAICPRSATARRYWSEQRLSETIRRGPLLSPPGPPAPRARAASSNAPQARTARASAARPDSKDFIRGIEPRSLTARPRDTSVTGQPIHCEVIVNSTPLPDARHPLLVPLLLVLLAVAACSSLALGPVGLSPG